MERIALEQRDDGGYYLPGCGCRVDWFDGVPEQASSRSYGVPDDHVALIGKVAPRLHRCSACKDSQARAGAAEARCAALTEALRDVLRLMSTAEVLGEWEALDINHRRCNEERAKVDAAIEKARVLLAAAPSPALEPLDAEAVVAAAKAVLYHDERGQGVGYAEAMKALDKAVARFGAGQEGA